MSIGMTLSSLMVLLVVYPKTMLGARHRYQRTSWRSDHVMHLDWMTIFAGWSPTACHFCKILGGVILSVIRCFCFPDRLAYRPEGVSINLRSANSTRNRCELLRGNHTTYFSTGVA